MQDRIAELELRLARVEARLSALEGEVPAQSASGGPLPASSLREGIVANAPTLIGRALLIFGGAYLLRAITDFEFVRTDIGILMGACYAVFWLFVAFRTSRADAQRTSAAVYGGLSILLAMPLLVEASHHFQLLSGRQSASALAAYCVLALGVAAIRDLRSLAWLTTAGGIATGLAIMIVSHSAVTVAVLLIALGLGTLWLEYLRDWMGLRWLGASGANGAVLAIVGLSTTDRWSIAPGTAAALATVLLIGYLLSFAYRTHARRCDVGLFEPLQAVAASGIVLWASTVAEKAGDVGPIVIGTLGILIACGSYALAFSHETRRARGRNFFFYSTLGLLFALGGTGMMLPAIAAAALWSLMAVTMSWLSGRTGRVALSLQCTLLLLAAGAYSGLLGTGLQALAGDAGAGWPGLLPAHITVAIATVVCLFVPVAQHSERWGVLAGMPQLVVLALSVWEVGGLMVVFMAPMLAAAASAAPNLAVLAALRTAVLSAASVTLALSSRHRRWPEARWLAYPLLVLVAIKLFAEDFPHGEPATLFVSLAFVGSALLLVAKLIRRGETMNAADQSRVTEPGQ